MHPPPWRHPAPDHDGYSGARLTRRPFAVSGAPRPPHRVTVSCPTFGTTSVSLIFPNSSHASWVEKRYQVGDWVGLGGGARACSSVPLHQHDRTTGQSQSPASLPEQSQKAQGPNIHGTLRHRALISVHHERLGSARHHVLPGWSPPAHPSRGIAPRRSPPSPRGTGHPARMGQSGLGSGPLLLEWEYPGCHNQKCHSRSTEEVGAPATTRELQGRPTLRARPVHHVRLRSPSSKRTQVVQSLHGTPEGSSLQ